MNLEKSMNAYKIITFYVSLSKENVNYWLDESLWFAEYFTLTSQ